MSVVWEIDLGLDPASYLPGLCCIQGYKEIMIDRDNRDTEMKERDFSRLDIRHKMTSLENTQTCGCNWASDEIIMCDALKRQNPKFRILAFNIKSSFIFIAVKKKTVTFRGSLRMDEGHATDNHLGVGLRVFLTTVHNLGVWRPKKD